MKDLLNKLVESSANPEQLSLTVQGFVAAVIVPIVALAFTLTGKALGQDDITGLINAIGMVVTAAASIVSSAMIIYGIVRKLVNALRS